MDRELSPCEIATNEFRSKFSPEGKNTSNCSPKDLFGLWAKAGAGAADDYRCCLHALNICYNFGLSIEHERSAVTRLLALCLRTRQTGEALALVKNYRGFLRHPPEPQALYVFMGILANKQNWLGVRELMQ